MVTLPLHTSGVNVLNSNNQIVFLRGINWLECGFTVSCTGAWYPNGDWMWGSGYHTFSLTGLNQRLAEMQSQGINALRLCINNSWWANDSAVNYSDSTPTNIHIRDALLQTIRAAATYGIYCILDFDFSNTFTNTAAFVSYWTNAANLYKNEPNVIFELWGEPNMDFGTWTTATQQACAAIRGTGATNLIWVQYGFCGSFNFVDTIAPLIQGYGNIQYSNHVYRYPAGATFPQNSSTTKAGIESVLRNNWSYGSVVGKYPMVVGEVGAYGPYGVGAGGSELTWFTNLLSLLNDWGSGYIYWEYGQLDPAWECQVDTSTAAPYALNRVGQALVNAIAASSPPPPPTNPTLTVNSTPSGIPIAVRRIA